MEQTLLFSKADFEPYADLPASLASERLEPHMLRAQRRLRPVLGEALYAELQRRVKGHAQEPVTDAWLELWRRCKPALVHAALAQYLPFSQTTATSHSYERKLNTQGVSEPIDARTLASQAALYDSEALSYEVELRDWLGTNAASFAGFVPQPAHCGPDPGPGRTATVVVQAIRRR